MVSKPLFERLIDEEADHGLRDAGVGCGQATVEAPDALRFVNMAGTLQGIHLFLPPGSEKSNKRSSMTETKIATGYF